MQKRTLLLWGCIFFLIIFTSAIFLALNAKQSFDLNCQKKAGATSTLIIIPGSKAKIPPVFSSWFEKFYRAYGVETGNGDWAEELRNSLSDSPLNICIFSWSGGITQTFSINPAAEKLAQMLEERNISSPLIFFGKSLGGLVAEKAITRLNNEKSIEKLIYVATPHASANRQLPEGLAIINIFSPADRYLNLANKVLFWGQGVTELEPGENIEIPNLKHNDFNLNVPIIYEGEKVLLFEFYRKIIQSS